MNTTKTTTLYQGRIDDFASFDNTGFGVVIECTEEYPVFHLDIYPRHNGTHNQRTTIFSPTSEGLRSLASELTKAADALDNYEEENEQ